MRLAWIVACGLWGCGGGPGDSGMGSTTGATSGQTTGSVTGSTTTSGLTTGTTTGTVPPTEWIVVGNGDDEHLPLSNGDYVTIVHGPQGGWHIDVSGEVYGTGVVVGLLVSATRTEDDVVVASNSTATFIQLAGWEPVGQVGIFVGERAFLDVYIPFEEVCALHGAELELCAEAEDLANPGTWASGCVTVIADPDPVDVEGCATL